MEKSRPRSSHPEIIDRRDLKSSGRRILESFITLAFWTGFLYLLIPLVTLCLWVFGVHIAYTQLIGAEALTQLLRIIKGGGLMVLSITLLILGWGYYNYLLFRLRGERRNKQTLVCYDEDFAARYHLDLSTLQTAKEQNRLLVSLSGSYINVLPAPGSLLPEDLSEGRFKRYRKAAGGRK
jgi:poly-beta-1,6-N-acetyl-D-glucosamine biosynthesis protein PgaD